MLYTAMHAWETVNTTQVAKIDEVRAELFNGHEKRGETAMIMKFEMNG